MLARGDDSAERRSTDCRGNELSRKEIERSWKPGNYLESFLSREQKKNIFPLEEKKEKTKTPFFLCSYLPELWAYIEPEERDKRNEKKEKPVAKAISGLILMHKWNVLICCIL